MKVLLVLPFFFSPLLSFWLTSRVDTHSVLQRILALFHKSFFFLPLLSYLYMQKRACPSKGCKREKEKKEQLSLLGPIVYLVSSSHEFEKESTPFPFLFRDVDVQQLQGDDQVHAVMSNFCYCWKMHQEPAAGVKRATAGRRKESLLKRKVFLKQEKKDPHWLLILATFVFMTN